VSNDFDVFLTIRYVF